MSGLHPAGRLALGAGVLTAAVVTRDAGVMAMGIVACALLVRGLSGCWTPVLRALRWLAWLAVPILLLHTMFTPGALIWPGWPFSVEGARQGALLSMRLALLFLAGMVCSRMLSAGEWQACLARAPWIGPRMYPWLRLLGPMRARTADAVRHHSGDWRLRSMRRWPTLLAAMVADVLSASREEGRRLWLRWHDAPAAEDWPGLDARAMLALAAGLALPLLAWMAAWMA